MPSSPDIPDFPVSALLDPLSCGEDLILNANRVAELAPILCLGCRDYHVRRAVQRAAGVKLSIAHDRPAIIRLISSFLATFPPEEKTTINIVIPGSADTGILSTCAHAAALLGPAVLKRCKFTVIDRCPTPLTLCLEFAGRYGISLETRQGDLNSPSFSFDADLIVVHSLLRFIAPDSQVELMKMFGSWLSRSGRIIFSISIRSGDSSETRAETRKHEFVNRLVDRMVESNELSIRESRRDLQLRMRRSMDEGLARSGEIRTPDEATNLFEKAGLRAICKEIVQEEIELGPGDMISRQRLLAVLESTTPRKKKPNESIN
jgi:hypothetical protein